MTDHWLDDPSPYLDRDAPRCRTHPTELGTNCRLCRSEAIADHDREPENFEPIAPVIPIRPREEAMTQPEPEPFDRVMVYVSEQTNQRRPGVRLVCTCGWGIVAVHADQTRPLAQIIAEARAHAEVCR